jgi:signal transduction histidine kinase/CheY-like chemotaxis protein
MATPLRVLIVEDQPSDAELIVHELRRGGFDPNWQRVESEAGYLASLHHNLDIVLSDYTMPQFDGLRALRLLQRQELDVPFIIVTGTVGEEAAVECLKQGAADYLLKDRLARLGPAVRQALQKKLLRDEKQQAEEALQAEAQISAALARMGRELIASLDTPTLLERLCQLIVEVLGCDYSSTFFWQPKEKAYVAVATYGHNAERKEILRALKIPPEAVTGLITCLQQEDVVEIAPATAFPLVSEVLLRQFGETAVLNLALRRGKELIGYQSAGYLGRGGFSSTQKRIAQGIAQLASLALENARLLQQAESANRLKSDFLATMSHELRTPLHIILGYTDLLLEGEFGRLTSEQRETMWRVDRSARELYELISATLDVSRLEAGRLPVESQEVVVADLFAELKRELQTGREKPGVRLSWRVAPQLPVLRTDRTKLKVIIKNLLSNAVKFTETGSITVKAYSRKGGVELCVADTGIGMTPEALEVIFEPFRQLESYLTRHYEGVGLGLYIVRQFVELLQGRIAVTSEVGRGSTFRVWLPLELSPHL